MPVDSPWGPLEVADAHVHFFSQRFFSALAAQKKTTLDHLQELLGWALPSSDPSDLARHWVADLDRHGVARAALIASVPGDQDSVVAAVQQALPRFFGYAMVDPTSPQTAATIEAALARGNLHGLCFFPAMHRYSMHDDRAIQLLDLVAAHPGTVAFVHCGVLSVGIRAKLGLSSPFDMRYSNPIDLHGIALRYPRVHFVVPHFGAGYFREALMLCDLCPNVFLDTSSSNSWMRYEPHLDLRAVFRRALDVVGPARLLFGSDSSFFPRGWNAQIFDAQSKALYEIGIEESAARLIFGDNLTHLFS
ncbi:MAG TPA: amidohydrolase family protein [Bryobacteraceae bacterium]|nr:amidohydrolase family protein [Bryobacteraceae bacterium]